MAAHLRIATTSIVLTGAFNPAVFHPYWFGARDLLAREMVESAADSVQTVGREVMMFETGWLSFQALPQRLAFTSKESAYHLEIRDLVIGTLSLLPETPIAAFGLNRDAHYRLDTEDEWHAIGDRFVANEPWAEITEGRRAGLLRLAVQVYRGEGENPGATNITIGPSEEAAPNGVYLGINDHFEVGDLPELATAAETIPTLEAVWESARQRANSIVRHIMG